MKKFNYLFSAAAIAAAMLMTSCNKEEMEQLSMHGKKQTRQILSVRLIEATLGKKVAYFLKCATFGVRMIISMVIL